MDIGQRPLLCLYSLVLSFLIVLPCYGIIGYVCEKNVFSFSFSQFVCNRDMLCIFRKSITKAFSFSFVSVCFVQIRNTPWTEFLRSVWVK